MAMPSPRSNGSLYLGSFARHTSRPIIGRPLCIMGSCDRFFVNTGESEVVYFLGKRDKSIFN